MKGCNYRCAIRSLGKQARPFLLARLVSVSGALKWVYYRNLRTFRAAFVDFPAALSLACQYYLYSSYFALYWCTNLYLPLPSSSSSLSFLFTVLNHTKVSMWILWSILIPLYRKQCCQQKWTRNFILARQPYSWLCPWTPSQMVSVLDLRLLSVFHYH